MQPPPLRPLVVAALVAALALASACLGENRSAESEGAEVAVRVETVALDRRAKAPVVILEEREGPRRLPIWIGVAEARSIASELEQEERVRPNTHDLAKRLVDRLEGAVERVVVTRLHEGVYYALITLAHGGERYSVDARPSDAIAIALRYGAPLFVREPLFEESGEDALEEGGQEIDAGPPRPPPAAPKGQLRL